jgi:hypothetical protein
MSTHAAMLEVATIRQWCKVLHLTAVGAQCSQLAERIREAHLPRTCPKKSSWLLLIILCYTLSAARVCSRKCNPQTE